MNNINKILKIWHTHFKDEKNQYTEFEPSDIEYFVGCMLYNHFNFLYALDTMKTMDLSYDFLQYCGDKEYETIRKLIGEINLADEKDKIIFLQDFIKYAQKIYTDDELYLINRLSYHVQSLADRYENDIKSKQVIFKIPTKNQNPLI